MKKELAVFTLALGLASTAPAFAGEMGSKKITEKKQPIKMTEKQLDDVAGGALINVVAFDVLEVNNNDVLNNPNIGVTAAAAVAALGRAGAAARNFQTR